MTLFGLKIPLVFTVALLLLALVMFLLRKKITLYRIISGTACVALMALSQRITDFYLDKPFYDIQYNWHYLAYCGYSIMLYRALAAKKIRPAWIIIISYFSAVAISVIDEINQCTFLGGIWDISDISKDCWGVIIGLIIVFFIYDEGKLIGRCGWSVRRETLKGYLESPWSVLVMAVVLDMLLMIYSSHLTDDRYWYHVLLFTMGSFLIVIAMVHLSRIRVIRCVLLCVLAGVLLLQTWGFFAYRDRGIVYNRPGMTVFRGVPVPFFDMIIFPDETWRIIDKKLYFYTTDIGTLMRLETDILLVGTGSVGQGGVGLGAEHSRFIYNRWTGRCTQLIMAPTEEACRTYNRLRKEGKQNVVFVINNS